MMFEYNGVKLTWLGHDAFRIQDGQVIYIDPYEIGPGAKADLVLVSHEHDDHCSIDDLKKIVTPNTVIVAHAQSKNELSKLSVKEIKIAKPGDKLSFGSVTVETVPAYNTNKFREPGKVFHPKEDGKLGFVVTVKGVRIYHAADTDHIPEMKGMAPDIALLPVSGTYVMTAKEAAEATASIKPKIAIPMHYASIVGSVKDAEEFKKLAKCEVKILQKEQ
ncbi:MAG: MBL fold metallo-hydrolase [Candidatus Bathyarchaeia archaeon]|jgi:L-ascorbate metabolism protein UlaG (beta-lactamase superfamily)